MNDLDRAIVAAAEERDRGWLLPAVRNDAAAGYQAAYDRQRLLRIVRELDHLLRERDTLAEDRADDAAAERATAGKWGAS